MLHYLLKKTVRSESEICYSPKNTEGSSFINTPTTQRFANGILKYYFYNKNYKSHKNNIYNKLKTIFTR